MINVFRSIILLYLFCGGYSYAHIEPSSVAGPPSTLSYTNPEGSGLKSRLPFPNSDDVCVSLHSNLLTKPFEVKGYFLIACPKHEIGAIEDRKSLQKAIVVGNAKHWVVLRVAET